MSDTLAITSDTDSHTDLHTDPDIQSLHSTPWWQRLAKPRRSSVGFNDIVLSGTTPPSLGFGDPPPTFLHTYGDTPPSTAANTSLSSVLEEKSGVGAGAADRLGFGPGVADRLGFGPGVADRLGLGAVAAAEKLKVDRANLLTGDIYDIAIRDIHNRDTTIRDIHNRDTTIRDIHNTDTTGPFTALITDKAKVKSLARNVDIEEHNTTVLHSNDNVDKLRNKHVDSGEKTKEARKPSEVNLVDNSEPDQISASHYDTNITTVARAGQGQTEDCVFELVDIPEKKTAPDILEKMTAQDILGKKTAQNIPEKKIAADILDKMTAQDILEKNTAQIIPEKKIAVDIFDKMTAQDILEKKTAQNIPEKKITADILEKMTAQDILKKNTANDIPEKKTAQDIPEKKKDLEIPEKKTVNKPIVAKILTSLKNNWFFFKDDGEDNTDSAEDATESETGKVEPEKKGELWRKVSDLVKHHPQQFREMNTWQPQNL